MKLNKVLLPLLVASTAANTFSGMIGLGVAGHIRKPAAKTGENVFTAGNAGPAATEHFVNDGARLKLKDDVKKINPADLHVNGAVLTNMGGLKLGLGAKAGFRRLFNLPTDGKWVTKNDAGANANLELTPAKNAFFVTPHVMAAFEIADMMVCLSAGLEIVRAEAKLARVTNGVDATATNWIYGLNLGAEGIYKVTSCFGIGLGLGFTYFPESMAKLKEKGKAKVFNAAAAEKDTLVNLGGTWSIMGSVTGHYFV